MKSLIKIYIILFLISFTVKSNEIEKILFSINKQIYTTIDLDNRINYINILSKNGLQLSNQNYLDDYISVLLYNEYSKQYQLNIEEKVLNDYLNDILIQSNITSSEMLITKNDILKNIRLDYQRKIILEKLLNNFKNKILKKENEIINIYNIKLNYFSFNNSVNKTADQLLKLVNFQNIDLTKKKLSDNLIDYIYFSKEINTLDNINAFIKKEILDNNEIFIIEENEYVLIGQVIKEFKNNIDLKLTFYKYSLNNIEDNVEVNCNNIEEIKDINVEKFSNIEITKLNDIIVNNLKSINDKILINNNDIQKYLILCEMNYDSETSENITINDKIDDEIIRIKNNFLFEQKNEYNFKWYE